MYKRFLIPLCFLVLACNSEKKEAILTVEKEKQISQKEYHLDVYSFDEFESLLHKEDDKTYVVNFWATWCAPCIKELPYFEELHESYKNEDVEVLLVSLDFPKLYEKNLIPFIKKEKLQSKVIALNDPDSNAWIPKVSEDWSGAIPATLIYNKNKRKFYEQPFNYDELKEEVQQFLK